MKKRTISLPALLRKLIPSYARIPLLIALLWNCGIYIAANLIAGTWPHHQIALPIDGRIPFLPWTASVYLGCYLFWVMNYILCARQGKESAYRFLSADFLAKLICFVCFLAFPTTNIRPAVPDGGFWNGVMAIIYKVDDASNLFPSIHCLVSWFCCIGLWKQPGVSRPYQIFSFVFAIAVFISTLTTKQHVAVDVLGGVVLASLTYHTVVKTGFTRLYTRIFDRFCSSKNTLRNPTVPENQR